MCGIGSAVAFKGNTLNQLRLKFLLLHNENRGQDAMGFYTEETDVVKKSGKPRDLLNSKEFIIPKTNMFLGHVRQMSSGGNTDENAHPFKFGNIVLVMNGTLNYIWGLCTKHGVIHTDIHVDSAGLCAILNKEKSKDVLSEIDGSCACVFTNTETKKLYVYRNSDRPLFRGIIEGEGMYISSTKESLELIDCIKINEFKQDSLYEIFEGVVIKNYPVKRYVKPPIVNNYFGTNNVNTQLTLAYKLPALTSSTRDNFIGRYVKCDRKSLEFYSSSINGYVTFNNIDRYLICVRNNDAKINEITVFHTALNKKVNISLYLCTLIESPYKTDDYVFSTRPIRLKENNKLFCIEGELLQVTKVYANGNLEVMPYFKTETCLITPKYYSYVKFATADETKAYWMNYDEEDSTKMYDTYANDNKEEDDDEPPVDSLEEFMTVDRDFKKKIEGVLYDKYEQLAHNTITQLLDLFDVVDMNNVSSTYETRRVIYSKMRVLFQNYEEQNKKLLKEANKNV